MAEPNVNILVTLKDQATAQLRALAGEVSKVSSSMQKNFDEAASYSKKVAVALAAAGAATVAFGYSAVSAAANIETQRIGFKTLLGSVEEADAAIKMIQKDAAETPFELAGLIEANKALTLVTKNAQKSEQVLLDVGKALAASGKGQPELDRIITNLQQIGNTGKITEMDIRQFGNSGVNILELLADHYGTTKDAASDMIKDSKNAFGDLSAAFAKAGAEGGIFADAFANATGSFNQALSNLKDSFNIFLAGEGEKFLQFGKDIVAWLTDFVQKDLPNWIKKMEESVKWLGENKVALAALAGVLAGLLAPAIVAAGIAVANFILVMGPWVIAATALALLGQQIYEHWGEVKAIVLGLITAVAALAIALEAAAIKAQMLAAVGLGKALIAYVVSTYASVTATGLLTTAMGGLKAAMLAVAASPLVFAIAAIGGAIAGVVYAVMSCKVEMQELAAASRESAEEFRLAAEEAGKYADKIRDVAPAAAGVVDAEKAMKDGLSEMNRLSAEYQDELSSTYNILGDIVGLESERAKKLKTELDNAIEKQGELTKNYRTTAIAATAADTVIATSRQILKETEVELSEEELQHRIKIFERETREYSDKVEAEIKASEGNTKKQNEIRQEALEYFRGILKQELSYKGMITDQQIAILKKYGADEVSLHASVTKFTAEQLDQRLKFLQSFGLSSNDIRKAILDYDASASNAELELYGNKLTREHEATLAFKKNLAAMADDPIVQNFIVNVLTNSPDEGLVGQTAGFVASGLGLSMNKVKNIKADYAATMAGITTDFESARDSLLAASTSVGDSTGGGASEATKKLKEQADAVKKVEENYDEAQIKISDSLLKLKEDHETTLASLKQDLDDAEEAMTDLQDAYNKGLKSEATSIGEKYVQQQEKIKDLQKELEDVQKQANKSKTPSDYNDRISEIQSKLETEKAALQEHSDLATTYAEEITEARKRADMTDFERFIYDTEQKRIRLDEEFKTDMERLQIRYDEVAQKIVDENKLYEEQEKEMQKLRLRAASNYEQYMSNLEDITKESADDMVAQLQRVLDMMAAVSGAKNSAGVDTAVARGYADGGLISGQGLTDTVPAVLSPGEEVVTRENQATLVGQIKGLISLLTEESQKPQVNQNITQYIGNGQSATAAAEEQFFAARTARFF